MAISRLVIKNIDIVFLLVIILVLQGSLELKLLGILIALILRFRAFRKLSGFSRFYLFMIVFHLLYGLINIFEKGLEYLVSFLLVFTFWSLAYIINTQIVYFYNKKGIAIQEKTINALFYTLILVVLGQYIYTSISLGSLNPYGITQAAGDRMKSIFANSSVSMLIMSFYFLAFFQKRKWIPSFLALVSLLMAAYMSGTILFLGASLLAILLFSNIKLSYKLYFVILIGVFVFFSISTSPENLKYAMGYINRIIENDESNVPFKLRSFWQTINYWLSSFKSFLFGAGGGNFSSRVAFIVSGDYVDWFPKSAKYISTEFASNHFDLWTHDFNNPWDNRNNTANQPFSFYNRIIGEYGLIGLIGFFGLYLGYLFRNWRKLSFSKYMLIALAGYFLLDYWFEYFAVMVVFELLVLYDLHCVAITRKT